MDGTKIRMVSLRDKVYIWDPDDWLKLRQEYRIIGNLIGRLSHLPRQNTFPGLPVTLLPEEVTLIIEKGIGYLTSLKDPSAPCSEETKEKINNYVEKVNKEQVECFEAQRKERVEAMIDRIIEGKKRKIMGLQTKRKGKVASEEAPEEASLPNIEIDREAILKFELQKAEESNPPSLLVHTFLADPWYKEDEYKSTDWTFPETPTDELRYQVFKDLWEKNYYITSGTKFGGDYLVYPGEPVKFHACFIVLCAHYKEGLRPSEIIMHSRIGNATRKSFVIASRDESQKIIYQSIQFSEIT